MSGILPQNGRASGVNVMMPVVIVIGVRSSIHGKRWCAASISRATWIESRAAFIRDMSKSTGSFRMSCSSGSAS